MRWSVVGRRHCQFELCIAKFRFNISSIRAFCHFAIAADRALRSCCDKLSSPYFHSYPVNCCELVPVHLGLTLRANNPESDIKIVCAYSHSKNKWHYWVEMDNLVFNLNAHQLEQCNEPLVCAKPSPFESIFPDIERFFMIDAARDAKFKVNSKIVFVFLKSYTLASSTSLGKRQL